jgi:hypothetical protein
MNNVRNLSNFLSPLLKSANGRNIYEWIQSHRDISPVQSGFTTGGLLSSAQFHTQVLDSSGKKQSEGVFTDSDSQLYGQKLIHIIIFYSLDITNYDTGHKGCRQVSWNVSGPLSECSL